MKLLKPCRFVSRFWIILHFIISKNIDVAIIWLIYTWNTCTWLWSWWVCCSLTCDFSCAWASRQTVCPNGPKFCRMWTIRSYWLRVWHWWVTADGYHLAMHHGWDGSWFCWWCMCYWGTKRWEPFQSGKHGCGGHWEWLASHRWQLWLCTNLYWCELCLAS